MSSPRKIGFIGLGLMGRPMAMNLLKAGHSLTVWNRTASRAQELVAAGATLAKSPREAAAASDILFTIVSDPPALEEVLWGHQGNNDGAMAGLRPGSIYIDSSTVAPALTRRVAAACAEHGVRYLDAPVTGSWSNFRPYTEDHLPVLGRTPVRGLVLATGHFRNGILLAPVTAEAIAELVATGRSGVDLAPFSIARFG